MLFCRHTFLDGIADALKIPADALLTDENIQVKDKELFKKFELIQEMEGDTKKMIINFLDPAIRDYKTKINYSEAK